MQKISDWLVFVFLVMLLSLLQVISVKLNKKASVFQLKKIILVKVHYNVFIVEL